MTLQEFEAYHNDLVRAEKLHRQGVDASWYFKEISRRKVDSGYYDIPYISVFEEE